MNEMTPDRLLDVRDCISTDLPGVRRLLTKAVEQWCLDREDLEVKDQRIAELQAELEELQPISTEE